MQKVLSGGGPDLGFPLSLRFDQSHRRGHDMVGDSEVALTGARRWAFYGRVARLSV